MNSLTNCVSLFVSGSSFGNSAQRTFWACIITVDLCAKVVWDSVNFFKICPGISFTILFSLSFCVTEDDETLKITVQVSLRKAQRSKELTRKKTGTGDFRSQMKQAERETICLMTVWFKMDAECAVITSLPIPYSSLVSLPSFFASLTSIWPSQWFVSLP
jgi:hypothetical protein